MKKSISLMLTIAFSLVLFIVTNAQSNLLNNLISADSSATAHLGMTITQVRNESGRNSLVNTDKENKKPQFSSIYSDLIANCKSIGGEQGGHVSTFCKGVGNYQIHVFDSATTFEFLVETLDRKDSIQLASQSLNYNTKRNKVEWRMANGVPFAVILRTNTYQIKDDVIDYPGKITGEFLVVKGLKGYENIDFKVNAKTPNANKTARQLADAGYAK